MVHLIFGLVPVRDDERDLLTKDSVWASWYRRKNNEISKNQVLVSCVSVNLVT